VQIRDPAKALPGQYVNESGDPADTSLPSRWRRVAAICAYLVLMFVVYTAVVMGLNELGIMSSACMRNASQCSAGERFFDTAAAVLILLLMALIIARGWRGRLFGARKAR
jgi:hypothetical protein